MQRFIQILTTAQIETSLDRLEDARRAHEEMIEEEKGLTTKLEAEIARVEQEDLSDEHSLTRIYLEQLHYDLACIKRDQARRVEMLAGRRKTIELFLKWDSAIAA